MFTIAERSASRERRRCRRSVEIITNVAITTKIRINGKDYESVDELPPELRRAYESAVHSSGADNGLVHAAGATTRSVTRITFNGQQYSSVSEMPAAVRKLYGDMMATLDADVVGGVGGMPPMKAAGVQAPTVDGATAKASRLIVIGAIIAALLLVSLLRGR